MLAAFGSWSVLWAILGLMAVVMGACALLPESRRGEKPAAGKTGAVWRLLRQPVFLLFLVAGGLGHASHAVLYGFATLHWRGVGYSDVVVGLLWAEGVAAEIVLFWLGNRLLRRFGAANLLVLGAGAGVIRWAAMGLSDALWLAFLTQSLHAFTFGAAHLGAMHFIARAAPQEMSATAQSLHGAVGAGIALGLVMALAGGLYDTYAAGAYFFMAGIALAGMAAALLLARRWNGEAMSLS